MTLEKRSQRDDNSMVDLLQWELGRPNMFGDWGFRLYSAIAPFDVVKKLFSLVDFLILRGVHIPFYLLYIFLVENMLAYSYSKKKITKVSLLFDRRADFFLKNIYRIISMFIKSDYKNKSTINVILDYHITWCLSFFFELNIKFNSKKKDLVTSSVSYFEFMKTIILLSKLCNIKFKKMTFSIYT